MPAMAEICEATGIQILLMRNSTVLVSLPLNAQAAGSASSPSSASFTKPQSSYAAATAAESSA